MAWFKVDDGWWSHPKVLQLSDAAQALWLRAGSWSMKHLTDGEIPAYSLSVLRAKRRPIAELLAVELWTKNDDGYAFHDWMKYQPSKEKVEQDRSDAAERQRKHREKSPAKSRRDSHDPDPTRPDPTLKEAKASSPHTIPKDWAPTAEHIQKARELGVDLLREAESFRLHAEANDRKAVRWNAAFSMWLTKATPVKPRARSSDDWMNR